MRKFYEEKYSCLQRVRNFTNSCSRTARGPAINWKHAFALTTAADRVSKCWQEDSMSSKTAAPSESATPDFIEYTTLASTLLSKTGSPAPSQGISSGPTHLLRPNVSARIGRRHGPFSGAPYPDRAVHGDVGKLLPSARALGSTVSLKRFSMGSAHLVPSYSFFT